VSGPNVLAYDWGLSMLIGIAEQKTEEGTKGPLLGSHFPDRPYTHEHMSRPENCALEPI
jgi:hypothetical protein